MRMLNLVHDNLEKAKAVAITGDLQLAESLFTQTIELAEAHDKVDGALVGLAVYELICFNEACGRSEANIDLWMRFRNIITGCFIRQGSALL